MIGVDGRKARRRQNIPGFAVQNDRCALVDRRAGLLQRDLDFFVQRQNDAVACARIGVLHKQLCAGDRVAERVDRKRDADLSAVGGKHRIKALFDAVRAGLPVFQIADQVGSRLFF